MKAIVNIGLRSVELQYSIKEKDRFPFNQIERNENFKNWEMFQKNKGSDILCKHTLWFKDSDEWQSSLLFDGRTVDFHYDYEERKGFDKKSDWANYLFQGYIYTDGEPQLFDHNIIEKVTIKY